MLKGLTIKNFSLIEALQVTFDSGLITITGETGAGKSLLLGALGLLLGKRASLSELKIKVRNALLKVLLISLLMSWNLFLKKRR